MERLPRYAEAAERLLADDLAYPVLLHARGARRRPEGAGGGQAAAALRRPLRRPDARASARRARPRAAAARSASGSARASSPSTTSSAATSRSTSRTSAATSSSSAPTARRSTTSRSSSTTRRWRSATSSAARTTCPTRPSTSSSSGRSGHDVPRFAHLPLILNPDRTQDEQAQEPDRGRRLHRPGLHPRGAGQLPRPARLGDRAPRRRSSSLDEIVERFDLDDVHKGGAVFDRERLEWLNGQWIRRLPAGRADRPPAAVRRGRAAPPGGSIGCRPTTSCAALLPVVQERLPTLGAIGDLVGFLWVDELGRRCRDRSSRSAGTRATHARWAWRPRDRRSRRSAR